MFVSQTPYHKQCYSLKELVKFCLTMSLGAARVEWSFVQMKMIITRLQKKLKMLIFRT